MLGLDLRKALPKTFGEDLQVPVLSPISQTPEWLKCLKVSDWIGIDYPTGKPIDLYFMKFGS